MSTENNTVITKTTYDDNGNIIFINVEVKNNNKKN